LICFEFFKYCHQRFWAWRRWGLESTKVQI